MQAVILEGHLLRAITWTPEIVAAFLGFNACLFALYTLTPVLLQRADATVLLNPGDSKNCKDFASYGEAKAWFDKYYPMYGDVAKLDGNGDGRPCESLLPKSGGR